MQDDSTPTLTCQTCGTPYQSKRRSSKYCSRACSGASRKLQYELQRTELSASCSICGSEIIPVKYKKRRTTCSDECAIKQGAKTQSNRVQSTCEQCRKPFERQASKGHRYCSKACSNDAQRAITGSLHPQSKPKVPVRCAVCGDTIFVKPSVADRGAKYCSQSCSGTGQQSTRPRTSSLELAVSRELDRLGEQYEPQKIIRWYVVDFYLPKRNLVIECDGEYWHSLPKVISRDKSKDTYMRTHNINIVRLTETEIREDVSAAVNRAILVERGIVDLEDIAA